MCKGAGRWEGTICVSMGELSARKRRDIVLGPGPAREELWDMEGVRRGDRWKRALGMGSDLGGGKGAGPSWPCLPSSSSS